MLKVPNYDVYALLLRSCIWRGDESLNFMSSTEEGYVHMYDWYNDIVSLILHAYNLFRIIYLSQTGC